MEKNYIFAAIGIFMIIVVITVLVMISYAIWKLALPKMNGSRGRYTLLTLFYVLLALGLSRCLLLGVELISLSF